MLKVASDDGNVTTGGPMRPENTKDNNGEKP